MKIKKYHSYQTYVDIQVAANTRKINQVWASKPVIKRIVEACLELGVTPPMNILCHGTRNGAEQRYFKEFLEVEYIIGTEISPSAIKFPDTIHWDFHKMNKSWLGFFDIVYSNSLDHSINPNGAVSNWLKSLKPTGILIIQWLEKQCTKTDPFSASTENICQLVENQGGKAIKLDPVGYEKKGRPNNLIFCKRAI